MKHATRFDCLNCQAKFVIYENYDQQQVSVYKELDRNPNEQDKPLKPTSESKKRGKGQRHCKKCGEPGHRRDNCPGGKASDDDDIQLEDKIQNLKNEGLTSDEVAKELGISLQKVNKYW